VNAKVGTLFLFTTTRLFVLSLVDNIHFWNLRLKRVRFNNVKKKIHHIWVNGIMIIYPTWMKLCPNLFGHAGLLFNS